MDWLSIVMIVQNEAHRLAALLSFISPYAKEIIIIDGGSTDGTQALVKQYPKVQLFEVPFAQDFAAQKNRAIEKATGEWVLLLDADEMPDADMMEALVRLTYFGYQAFAFPRKTRIDGRLYNLIDHLLS